MVYHWTSLVLQCTEDKADHNRKYYQRTGWLRFLKTLNELLEDMVLSTNIKLNNNIQSNYQYMPDQEIDSNKDLQYLLNGLNA